MAILGFRDILFPQSRCREPLVGVPLSALRGDALRIVAQGHAVHDDARALPEGDAALRRAVADAARPTGV